MDRVRADARPGSDHVGIPVRDRLDYQSPGTAVSPGCCWRRAGDLGADRMAAWLGPQRLPVAGCRLQPGRRLACRLGARNRHLRRVSFMALLSTTAILVAVMTLGRQRWIALGHCARALVVRRAAQARGLDRARGESRAQHADPGRYLAGREVAPGQAAADARLLSIHDVAGTPDSELVVWPEVAIPSIDDRVEPYIEALQADTGRDTESNHPVRHSRARGEPRREQDLQQRHTGEPGTGASPIANVTSCRFGEYFPGPASVREWMRMMSLPHSDLSRVPTCSRCSKPANGQQLAVAICYEDAYGAEQLYALPDASILINVSNDAWFGDSIAPHQHLEIARMRSLEAGRPTIRATNTGISAFIDHRAWLLETGAQFEAGDDDHGRSAAHPGTTPYARFGNKPVIGLCLLILAGFWLRNRANL